MRPDSKTKLARNHPEAPQITPRRATKMRSGHRSARKQAAISIVMQCPKCGHAQQDTVKCDSCGIYFAKFQQHTAPAVTEISRQPQAPWEGRGRGTAAAAIAVLACAAAVFYFLHGRSSPSATSRALPPDSIQRPDSTSAAASALAPATASDPTLAPAPAAPTVPAEQTPGQPINRPRVAAEAMSRNPIEAARNATVLIKSGLGLGSGFIVDEDCHVITNRHVVETDVTRVENRIVQDPDARARNLLVQQQLQASILRAQQLRSALSGQPGTNMEQLELDKNIVTLRQQLADLATGHSEILRQKVEESARSGFTATLVDGREFGALHASYAAQADLALFKLPTDHCPYIPLGHSVGLTFGERLYAVGNPSGLAYTVTSGVFSGMRTQGQQRLLQTDTPINPGNSGGPLITQDGQVIGINTLGARGLQGVGFAIPIETVYEEFPDLRGSPAD